MAIIVGLPLILVLLVTIPIPSQLREQVDEADIFIATSQRFVLLPSECVDVQWQMDNIQAIRFADGDTVGVGNRTICLDQYSPVFEVEFRSGNEQQFPLPITILT
ncbi:MAG: hypothetical protein AAF125_23030, partial [Chloroflexota bacterium]